MSNELVTTEQATAKMVVDVATNQAKHLMDIVNRTKCFQVIQGKKYLQVEAWETIGAFNRTHAETECVEPISNEEGETIGYKAHVQLWKDGKVVGGAVMPCFFSENCCKGKEGDAKHKACMSAAQTFATSKAYRMNFSYVAILAGYQPLPADEVTEDMRTEAQQPDKTEHWCEEHQTKFFKSGKMKSYAHPIKDASGKTTGWCNESEATESPYSQENPDRKGITQEQKQTIRQKSTEMGYTKDKATKLLKDTFEVDSIDELNYEQADLLIADIENGVGL